VSTRDRRRSTHRSRRYLSRPTPCALAAMQPPTGSPWARPSAPSRCVLRRSRPRRSRDLPCPSSSRRPPPCHASLLRTQSKKSRRSRRHYEPELSRPTKCGPDPPNGRPAQRPDLLQAGVENRDRLVHVGRDLGECGRHSERLLLRLDPGADRVRPGDVCVPAQARAATAAAGGEREYNDEKSRPPHRAMLAKSADSRTSSLAPARFPQPPRRTMVSTTPRPRRQK